MKNYSNEIEGQEEFYSKLGVSPAFKYNTDGVFKGCLYENKLNIDNINKVLFQAIKYCSRIREKGEKLPALILLNSLNTETAYIFNTERFKEQVEKLYLGAFSKDNDTFTTEIRPIVINYSRSEGLSKLLLYVEKNNYIKYNVDRTNILGLSRHFYKHNQNKDAFLYGINAEIRKPNILKDRILPYRNPDSNEFEDIMDCLNPSLLQREQGAYYTPVEYVKLMQKMLIQAINEIPSKKEYIVVDRCAGVGNLFDDLPDNIMKNCILSTIEPNEYLILRWKFGDKCAVIIPNTDALAFDIIPVERNGNTITNDLLREKINNDNCIVILVENPPYSEAGSGGSQITGRKENLWKKSFVFGEMKKEVKGSPLNELSNLFIWSGFKYYLRNNEDSFILFSPTKYWRNQNLVNRKYQDGFLCNRRHFHASQQSAIGCIWWKNINDERTQSLKLDVYDIKNNNYIRLSNPKSVIIKKAKSQLSDAYDRRPFDNDVVNRGLICEKDGSKYKDDKQLRVSPISNNNIIGYIQADSFSIDRKTCKLLRGAVYNGHGFYLRKDLCLDKIPLFVTSCFPYNKWWRADVYSKSNDGKGSFLKDKNFIKSCFLWTILTPNNKCRTIKSNKTTYKNELCFSKTGNKTYADEIIKKNTRNGTWSLTNDEKTIIKYWKDVLFEATKTKECNKIINYGLWQIKEEINIKISLGFNKKKKEIFAYKYPTLNTEIAKLENALKPYYAKEIEPKLFKYKLIK